MKGALKDNMSPQEWRDYMAKQNAAKESRYKAVPTETNDGQHFKSHIEASYYKRCWVLKQSPTVTSNTLTAKVTPRSHRSTA
jgi:phosphopantetheinyl transferase (holo-ACP synthase)